MLCSIKWRKIIVNYSFIFLQIQPFIYNTDTNSKFLLIYFYYLFKMLECYEYFNIPSAIVAACNTFSIIRYFGY